MFCLVGAGQRDDRAQHDEARAVGDVAGRGVGVVQGGDVLVVAGAAVRPVDRLHVPAVGLVAQRDVLAERDVGVVLDGDLVVVVEHGEVAEPLVAGERRRLGRHALLQVAVGGEDVDVVVEDALARRGVRVEQAALAASRHGHADGVADALAEGSGGDLDARRVVVLRVAGRLAAPGAQALRSSSVIG